MRIGALVNTPGGMGTVIDSEMQGKKVKRWQVKLASGATHWYNANQVLKVHN